MGFWGVHADETNTDEHAQLSPPPTKQTHTRAAAAAAASIRKGPTEKTYVHTQNTTPSTCATAERESTLSARVQQAKYKRPEPRQKGPSPLAPTVSSALEYFLSTHKQQKPEREHTQHSGTEITPRNCARNPTHSLSGKPQTPRPTTNTEKQHANRIGARRKCTLALCCCAVSQACTCVLVVCLFCSSGGCFVARSARM